MYKRQPLSGDELVVIGSSGYALRFGSAGPSLVRLADGTPVAIDLGPCEQVSGGNDAVTCRAASGNRSLRLSDMTWLDVADEEVVSLEGDGWEALQDDGSEAETPSGPPPAPPPVPTVGARGILDVAWSPAHQLALGTSSEVALLSEAGIRSVATRGGQIDWGDSAEYLMLGRRIVPLDTASLDRPSTRTEVLPYLGEEDDDGYLDEVARYQWWLGGIMDEPVATPICNAGRPRRCVRTVASQELGLQGWTIFAPTRPDRELGHIDVGLPAVGATAFVGAAWVRVVDESGRMRLEPLAGGASMGLAAPAHWAELAAGWVLVTEDEPTVLSFVPDGPGEVVRRTFDFEIDDVTIVDDGHVLIRIRPGHTIHRTVQRLEVPSLASLRDYAPSVPRHARRCDGADLVVEASVADETVSQVHPGACPHPVPDDDTLPIAIAGDGAFWAEPLGERVRIHREADGAVLEVRMTTEGVLVVGPGQIYEATGTIAEHLVHRAAGPVRSAAITTGAEVRERFERPGLIAAFFSGQPLP